MWDSIPEGIPQERDYRELIASASFKKMEGYSDGFLVANRDILKGYMDMWVADPLHQWSRQWEYPFVYAKIRELAREARGLRILDAGSGATFFPYFLSEHCTASVHCCDYDASLEALYRQINARCGQQVEFALADLRELPYQDEYFDVVYCISVLEHTDAYAKIIEEFNRILRPGGRLIVTIDLSLDGTREIDLEQGSLLLSAIAKRFDKHAALPLDLRPQAALSGIFTTLTANAIDPALLPWKRRSLPHRLKSFLRTGRFGSWPPPLTVFCFSLTKRSV